MHSVRHETSLTRGKTELGTQSIYLIRQQVDLLARQTPILHGFHRGERIRQLLHPNSDRYFGGKE
jgi:hypothetical protein